MKKLLLVLLLIAGAVAAVVALRQQQAPPPPLPSAWPEYGRETAETVAVKGPGGSYVLERTGKGWRLRLPERDVSPLADADKVSSLLEFLTHNRPILRLRGLNEQEAGFVASGPSVAINGVDLLEIGGEDGSGVGVYARRSGQDGVFVLTREYADVLSRPARFYLELDLMDLDPETVVGVSARHDGEAWGLERTKTGWEFSGTDGLAAMRVHDEDVGLWLHEVATLRASGLADPLPEGVAPRFSATFRVKGADAQRTLALYAPAQPEGMWLATSGRQDAVFLLDPEQANKVEKRAFSLVDRRLAALDPGAVDRLLLSASQRRMSVRRDGTSWSGESAPDGLTGIDMLLWRLTDLQYEYGPVGALPATAEERMHLELFNKDGSEVLDLMFYADSGLPAGQCWVARGGEPGFYPVADQIYKDMQSLLPSPPEGAANQ